MRLYHTRRYTVEATQVTNEILDNRSNDIEYGGAGAGYYLDIPGQPGVYLDDYLVRVGDEDVFVLSPDQFHALFSETP